MKIVTYNINGVRSAIKKGLLDWISDNDFDIVCLQETKAHSGSVPTLLIESLGYKHHWHSAQRKGYSGVATFSKTPPTKVFRGLGIVKYDREGRVLRTDFDDLTILNCYFPNGGSGDERHAYKMAFLDDFHFWLEQLLKERPNVIIAGDYNIAHHPIDINDPIRNKNASGFRIAERNWMTRWFETGFVDAFRHLHPREVSYTWWRTTQLARRTNQGWRLDYHSVSDSLVSQIESVEHLKDVEHSDHCPVLLTLKP